MNKSNRSAMLLIVSMAIFGTLGPFVRNISASSGELALYRAIIAAVLVGIFLIITKQKLNFSHIKKEFPLLLISGMAMGINWILLFEAGFMLVPLITAIVYQEKAFFSFLISTNLSKKLFILDLYL